MDIGIGIKNSILVLLIILIVHVILKSREPYCDGPKMKPQSIIKDDLLLAANCDLKQDKKNMMIINEYENDKVKEGDIPAFDDYDINYEYYLQAEKCAVDDKGGFGDFMIA